MAWKLRGTEAKHQKRAWEDWRQSGKVPPIAIGLWAVAEHRDVTPGPFLAYLAIQGVQVREEKKVAT